MKRLSNLCFHIPFLFCLCVLVSGCNKKLDEQPRSILTPQYFQTAAGLNAGVVAAYSGLRYQFGPEGALTLTVPGTDEFTIGGGANSSEVQYDSYGPGLNSTENTLLTPWNNDFTYINTCNGVIQLGPTATGLTPAQSSELIGEAKFLRGFYYFLLVQQFGGVPLDLGAGRLKFNTSPSTHSSRDSLSTCYAAIIQDMLDASTALPAKPSAPGRAGQAAALATLAKVYLSRAGSSVAQSSDYSSAYTTATSLINNESTYSLALLSNFALVNLQGNEHSSESIFTVEHTGNFTTNESGSGANTTAGNGGLKQNVSCFLFTPYYQIQTTYNGKAPVARTILYQRPYRRFKPTAWLLDTCYADKVNDSRYNNTFRTLWLCNTAVQGPLGPMNIGDTAFFLPGYDPSPAELAMHNYSMWGPSQYGGAGPTSVPNFPSTPAPSESLFPHMMKFEDTARAGVNDPSTRPQIIVKLSEVYLTAAEAALMMPGGGGATALPYINDLRIRAAYRATNSSAQNATAVTNMTITDPTMITLDFVLDERSRELCGEQLRWFDLVRTNKLVSRVQMHNANGSANVQPRHMLRPIPQTQINLVQGTPFPQNPGY
jgi:starch-binding outer membrane protein, SusD/RagB family